jgi:pyroglutamyl-peptidase
VRHTFLLTGFGPFPGVRRNASDALARRLARVARRRFAGSTFVHATLPTEWVAAPVMLEELMVAHRPDFALHFGVSHQAEGLVFETSARNAAEKIDATGTQPLARELMANQPEVRLTSLPAARVVNRLRRIGLPANVSHDAGAYLCNAVFFHSLRISGLCKPGAQSAFIHVPAALATRNEPLSLPEAVQGGLEIIATVLKLPPATQPVFREVA